jgi:pyruvate ferredoxin oxidoreductase alpha subunit
VCLEVKAGLYERRFHPYIQNFVAGLGGRDVTVEVFEDIVSKLIASCERGDPMGYEIINVRE